jgi:peptidoglycan/LPS O-acetylase OafA/YrhL
METPIAQASPGWNLNRLRRITTASHRYMAEVDGLRFVAIFGVMFFHVFFMAQYVLGNVAAHAPFSLLIWPVTHGSRGVQLFFIISGFILGLPFAAHYLANGPSVKVGKFYLRRLTRLEPPYVLALLLFYASAELMHNEHTHEPGFMASLPIRLGYSYLFIFQQIPPLDGPTWSLEIEVQFYLLAPLLAQVFKLPAWPRRVTLLAAICGAPYLAHVVPRGESMLLGHIEFFLTGFLLADIHTTAAAAGWLSARLYDLLGIACLLEGALAPETPMLKSFLPWLLAGIFVSALRGDWVTSVLRRPLISVLGGMCYSLYLLHNPLFSFVAHKILRNGMSLPEAYLRLAAVGLPFAVAAGIVYYILVERPCMNPNWPRLAFERVSKLIGDKSKTVRP